MPFIAHDTAGRVVRPATYDEEMHDGRLVCPGCGWRMRFQDQTPNRVAYFAHLPRKRDGSPGERCAWDISVEHHNALRTLQGEPPQVFDTLAGVNGKEEAWLDGCHRRADVFYPGTDPLRPGEHRRYTVAFEAQFSGINFNADLSGRTIEERTRDYHAKGVHVVWCFFQGRPKAERLYHACLKRYGCAGWLSSDGLSVAFGGADALWLDEHPVDALDKRNAARQREIDDLRRIERAAHEAEERRRQETARQWREQIARIEAREQAEREARRLEAAERSRLSAERLRVLLQQQAQDAERRRLEYERMVEERRRVEREAVERARAQAVARIVAANERLGVVFGLHPFTVEPVEAPPCKPLGTPRRALYRVLFCGDPVGWSYEHCVHIEIPKLNEKYPTLPVHLIDRYEAYLMRLDQAGGIRKKGAA